jgi:hypothetical protein
MSRTHDVNEPDHRTGAAEPGTGAVLDAYLRELAGALGGSPRATVAVIDEVRDGLLEAVDSYRAHGLTNRDAARAAVTEFGPPRLVAGGFRVEFGARQARRTTLTLLLSGPLIGLTWIFGAKLGSLPPATGHLTGPWWALPVVGLALLIAVPTMLFTVAATGRPGLRFSVGAHLPPKAAGIACLTAAAADTALLTAFTLYALATPPAVALIPVTPAIAASLTRLCLAVHASRRCLSAGAALTG